MPACTASTTGPAKWTGHRSSADGSATDTVDAHGSRISGVWSSSWRQTSARSVRPALGRWHDLANATAVDGDAINAARYVASRYDDTDSVTRPGRSGRVIFFARRRTNHPWLTSHHQARYNAWNCCSPQGPAPTLSRRGVLTIWRSDWAYSTHSTRPSRRRLDAMSRCRLRLRHGPTPPSAPGRASSFRF